MNLSDETSAPVVDETTGGADVAGLESKVNEITADRDRLAADKTKLVAKLDARTKELEAARAEIAAVSGQRDSLRSERDATAAQRETALAERDRLSAEVAAAAQEIARLNDMLASAPKPDPVVVFTDLATEKTTALVAWLRSKIPADSPHLEKFDRTIAFLTKAGCITVKTTRDIYVWLAPRLAAAYAFAKPHALELYGKAKGALQNKG